MDVIVHAGGSVVLLLLFTSVCFPVANFLMVYLVDYGWKYLGVMFVMVL